MNEIHIRRANPEDAQVIAAHNAAIAKETENKILDPQTGARGVAGLFEDPGRGFYLLAERESAVIGQLMVTFEWSDWRDGDFWWIQSVYVRPEARRDGVFSALYRHLEKEAKAAPKVCGLRLYAETENTRAHSTYESLGMRPAAYRMYEVDWS
jgi:ribosomal protein S18 acetylase RimI-like enzyme